MSPTFHKCVVPVEQNRTSDSSHLRSIIRILQNCPPGGHRRVHVLMQSASMRDCLSQSDIVRHSALRDPTRNAVHDKATLQPARTCNKTSVLRARPLSNTSRNMSVLVPRAGKNRTCVEDRGLQSPAPLLPTVHGLHRLMQGVMHDSPTFCKRVVPVERNRIVRDSSHLRSIIRILQNCPPGGHRRVCTSSCSLPRWKDCTDASFNAHHSVS